MRAAAYPALIRRVPEFLKALGVAYHRAGRFDDAVDTLRRALTVSSSRLERATLLDLISRVHFSVWNTTAQLEAVEQALRELGKRLPRNRVLQAVSRTVPLDKDVATDVTSIIGCAVMTGAGAALNAAQVRPGNSVVIIGAGGVGLSVVQACANLHAYPIIVVDLSDDKLEFARKFGATIGINARTEDPVARVRELMGGELTSGVDVAFDAIGIGQKHGVAGVLHQRPEMVLTLAQRRALRRQLLVERLIVQDDDDLADDDQRYDHHQVPEQQRFGWPAEILEGRDDASDPLCREQHSRARCCRPGR